MAQERKDQSPPAYNYPDGNVAGTNPTFDAPSRMVPDFQGKSGQGDNQSTDRPKGSV